MTSSHGKVTWGPASDMEGLDLVQIEYFFCFFKRGKMFSSYQSARKKEFTFRYLRMKNFIQSTYSAQNGLIFYDSVAKALDASQLQMLLNYRCKGIVFIYPEITLNESKKH